MGGGLVSLLVRRNGDGELRIALQKRGPAQCLWQAATSTQKTKRETRPAIGRSAGAHPRRSFGFSLITLLPRHLHGQKRVVAFKPTTRSRRGGLVWTPV